MSVKVCIPRCALIIDGKRHLAGEPVSLTDEQYKKVSAYVDVVEAAGTKAGDAFPADEAEKAPEQPRKPAAKK